MVSDLCKNDLCVNKTIFKNANKIANKKKKKKKRKKGKIPQSLADSGDKTCCSCGFLRPNF